MKPRTTFHHGDLRRSLVDAAVQLLGTREASSISLREVARVAGVAPSAPYHHFPTRADLLAAVAVEGFNALGEAVSRAERRASEPREALRLRVAAYVRFALAHLGHYRVMFDAELRDASQHGEYDAVALEEFAKLEQAVARVRPDLDPGALRRATFSAWSLAHGTVALLAAGAAEALLGRGANHRAIQQAADATLDLVENAR